MTDCRGWINCSMGVEALVLRASPKEIVSARWSGLGSESVAEIASISRYAVAAPEYGRTNRDFVGIVDTWALSASRTVT